MVLLDVEKAFDNVWHNGLIHKLFQFGFPLYLVKIVKSFLTGRSFKVLVNGTSSDLQVIPAGVPQDSVLAPILYNIFTSFSGCHSAMFADDTCNLHLIAIFSIA